MSINWDDPADRLALIERVGVAEYNRLQAEHIDASTVDTVNGHAIRPVNSGRFGRIYMVGSTGKGFTTIEAARDFAAKTQLGEPAR